MHVLLLALMLQRPVDSAVELVMRTQHVAGLSLGIAQRERILYERGYGDRDVLRHLPAQADTVYRIGSLTKAFTARGIELLAARGKLGLDRPAARYVRTFPWNSAITVRDLLAQRSGIPSYTDDPALNPYAWHPPARLALSVANQPVLFDPGTQYAYSNTNYVLLGMIAQHVTHETFEDFENSRVVAPLRLRHTRYGDQPDEALGYAWDGRQFQRATPSSPAYAFAAAAMSSNVPDLLRFLATMKPPYYGLMQSEQFGEEVWYAAGNVDGYSAFAVIVPRTGMRFVALCNADKLDLAPLALDILRATGQSPWQEGFGPPQNEDPRVTAQIRKRAALLLAPERVILLEFLREDQTTSATRVTYRVTLANGVQLLLSAPVSPDGTVGEISVSQL